MCKLYVAVRSGITSLQHVCVIEVTIFPSASSLYAADVMRFFDAQTLLLYKYIGWVAMKKCSDVHWSPEDESYRYWWSTLTLTAGWVAKTVQISWCPEDDSYCASEHLEGQESWAPSKVVWVNSLLNRFLFAN